MNPIVSKLCQWLDATTSYSTELKENVDLKPNHSKPDRKWRTFYYHGPMLVQDQGLLDASGNATGYKLAIKTVAYDHSVQVGEIITSGNGKRYMVQPNGSLRKV